MIDVFGVRDLVEVALALVLPRLESVAVVGVTVDPG